MENYVGKRLDGRYEIIEIIGVGGMAVVYKAFDNIEHKIVAVKILKNEFLENEDFKRRFKNESKAIALLSHENIVKIYDVSNGNMLQYIVMEYVEGITLKEYIVQQGKVSPREAIYYITQILRALQHAHDKGIVHRDIKPQNIMLISDGTIKVTDFGIARFSRGGTRTMTEGAIGSVHYISPEQAKGSIIDAKTDLYSVGVMLYELLTGTLPFQSDNVVSVALMQLQNDPVKPREINPEIPVGLEQIIIRAMQKNVNDRYQSASEILRDIEEFKKNPNIKFNYSMFSNTTSSLLTDESDDEVRLAPNTAPSEPVREPEENEEIEPVEADNDAMAKKKTIAVLSGVLAALVIFAVILISFFAPDSTKVNVPDLMGKNFYNDVMYNSLYADFNFEPVIDKESKEESGTIISQSPSTGKIEKGGTIVVYIADSKSEVEIPDVVGYEYSSAEATLRSQGFEVTVIMEVDESVELNKVIRTSPSAGAKAENGSTVTIYVSANEVVEYVTVPDLVGLTVSQAIQKLREVGLYLNQAKTEYRGSLEPAGKIIGHEFIGEEIPVGSSVAVYVSTGVVPEDVLVPDIIGLTLEQAAALLKEAELEIDSSKIQYVDSDEPQGTIISYEFAGEEIPVGTAIGVVVSNGPTTTEPTTESTTAEHEHKFKLIKEKDATCLEDGYKKYECSECGETKKDTIKALGHTKASAVAENKIPATCTEKGSYDRVVYCSVCNIEIKREKVEIEATGHNIVQDAAKAPACTEDGLTAGSHCSVCGIVTVAQTPVDATGHSIVDDAAKKPTCTEPGFTAGSHCSLCGYVSQPQDTIPATGHNDANGDGKCDVCSTVTTPPEQQGELSSDDEESEE